MTTRIQKQDKQAALVEVGNKIKFRLQERIVDTGSHVGIDWLRFTVKRKINSADAFPPDVQDAKYVWGLIREDQCQANNIKLFPSDFEAFAQAYVLGMDVVRALGSEFQLDFVPQRGKDYYKFRLAIMREESECGWVGFLSSTNSKSKDAQDKTIHVNLYGHACTFAETGWLDEVKNIIDFHQGVITRVDLALDIFETDKGFMSRIVSDYEAGLMNVAGQHPTYDMAGKWFMNPNSRSFYVGSKEAGKQTNIYEKGHQLYGADSGSTWCRIEARIGNKLRVIPSDVLLRPAEFFAGCSDWHAQVLREFTPSLEVQIKTIPLKERLPIETVKAEAYRSAKWLITTAKNSIAQAWDCLGADEFLELVIGTDRPNRLKRFSEKQIKAVYPSAFRQAAGIALPGDSGLCPA